MVQLCLMLCAASAIHDLSAIIHTIIIFLSYLCQHLAVSWIKEVRNFNGSA